MNSCFKLQDDLDNYPDPIAVAFEHLTSLMAFTLTTFPETGEERGKKILCRGLKFNQKASVLSFSLKSALSSFSELNYIKYKQKFTTNRLFAWQVLLRDQNLKWSGDRVLIFCSVEMLCSNHSLFCSERTFIFSTLLS